MPEYVPTQAERALMESVLGVLLKMGWTQHRSVLESSVNVCLYGGQANPMCEIEIGLLLRGISEDSRILAFRGTTYSRGSSKPLFLTIELADPKLAPRIVEWLTVTVGCFTTLSELCGM